MQWCRKFPVLFGVIHMGEQCYITKAKVSSSIIRTNFKSYFSEVMPTYRWSSVGSLIGHNELLAELDASRSSGWRVDFDDETKTWKVFPMED